MIDYLQEAQIWAGSWEGPSFSDCSVAYIVETYDSWCNTGEDWSFNLDNSQMVFFALLIGEAVS